jgi:hypothetical protein
MIKILTILERKTSAMEKKVETIKMKMAELTKKKKVREFEERGAIHEITRPNAYRCTMGRALVMLGLVGLAISAASSEVKPSENFRNNSQVMNVSRRGARRRNPNCSDDLVCM